jgi:hypothetical protein
MAHYDKFSASQKFQLTWRVCPMYLDVSRRNFIGGLGAFTAMLMIQRRASAESAELILTGDDTSFEFWRGSVTRLITNVVEDQDRRREMVRALATSTIYWSSSPTSFHESFCSPYLFDARLSPARTIQERWFELNLRPMFDTENPCRSVKDLNLPEILRITHEYNTNGRVLSPCNHRMQPTNAEYDNFCKTTERYGLDPKRVTWLYTRPFTTGRNRYLGHAIAVSKPSGSTSVPPSTSGGATSKDLLLSAESF